MKVIKELTMVLSTGHITKKDNDLLQDTYDNRYNEDMNLRMFTPYPFKIMHHEEGWVIYIPQELELRGNNAHEYLKQIYGNQILREFLMPEFSEAFIDVLKLAQEQDCCWINFDSGEQSYEDLTLFDW